MITLQNTNTLLDIYEYSTTPICVMAFILALQVRTLRESPLMVLIGGSITLMIGAFGYSYFQNLMMLLGQSTDTTKLLAAAISTRGQIIFLISNASSLGISAIGAGLITYALTMPGHLNPFTQQNKKREEKWERDKEYRKNLIEEKKQRVRNEKVINTLRAQRQAARQPGRRVRRRSPLLNQR